MAKKMFYSMGEVAEMFDVKPSLLRHWEAKFDILRPHKNKKGNRMFTPEDVENLKLIYHLVKERGMTLAGAAQYLKNGITDTMRRDMELLDRLQKIRAELVEQIEMYEFTTGKVLAECVQENLKKRVDGSNHRQAKENDSYYILRTTKIPAVIVECGFLSNHEEEKMLNDAGYQEKLAWAIYCGILDYFENSGMI